MRRFLMMIGLGFGLALGGGLIYSVITNETARLFIIAITMFILGATIVGVCIVAGNYLMVRAFTGRQERTTVNNYPSPVARSHPDGWLPWASATPPALPPPTAWSGFGVPQVNYPVTPPLERGEEDMDDNYVA